MHELRNRLGDFENAIEAGKRNEAIDAVNGFQIARRELQVERVYLPPELDNAFDVAFAEGSRIAEELGTVLNETRRGNPANPPTASSFNVGTIGTWQNAVLTWKYKIWSVMQPPPSGHAGSA